MPVPGLVQQIGRYLETKPETKGSIYALVIGANDVRPSCCLRADLQIFFNPNVTAEQVIARVANATASLRKQGARAFLIGAEYSFSEAPFAANASASDKALYSSYAKKLRSLAEKLVDDLKKDGSKAARLDFYGVTNEAFRNPAKYGFAVKYRQTACLQGAYGGTRSLCSDPDKHLWWDDVRATLRGPLTRQYHQTTKGHQRLAAEAKKRIASL